MREKAGLKLLACQVEIPPMTHAHERDAHLAALAAAAAAGMGARPDAKPGAKSDARSAVNAQSQILKTL